MKRTVCFRSHSDTRRESSIDDGAKISGRLASAAFLVLFAAAAGTRIVAANYGALVAHGAGRDDFSVRVIPDAVVAAEFGDFMVREGNVFLPIGGDKFDGALFVVLAAAAGVDDLQV